MRLEAHKIAIELPRGWSGRIFRRDGGNATLHAASFPLALHDGEFGDASTARMAPGASFLSLAEYVPGAGLEAGRGLFAPGRIELPLDPTRFSIRGLAHPGPDSSATSSSSPRRAGRSACTSSSPVTARHRRRQLPLLDGILRGLRID